MSTNIDICNNALDLIGQGLHISNLGEDSKEASSCNRLYEPTLRRCLERHNWSFARRTAQISTLVSSTSHPFKNSYKAPDDLIRALYIQPNNTAEQNIFAYDQDLRFDYRVENGQKLIITPATAPFYLQYQVYVDDLDLLPTAFIEYVEYCLAARLAADIIKGVEGVQIAQALEQRADVLLKALKEQDLPLELPVDELTAEILALVGQGIEPTIETKRKMVTHVAKRYPAILQRCIESRPWSFTRKSKEIKTSDALPTNENEPFNYTYKLPSDCMNILFITPNNATTQGGMKLYDTDTLFDFRSTSNQKAFTTSLNVPFTITYQSNSIDDNQVPHLMQEAVKCFVASELLVNFFRTEQTQDMAKSNNVNGDNAQQLHTKAEDLLDKLWREDPPLELPVDELTAEILALVGQGIEPTIETKRKMVTHVARKFKVYLKAVLEKHLWSFCRKSLVVDEVRGGLDHYANAYDLPEDFIKGLYLIPQGEQVYTSNALFDFRTNGKRQLVTNLEPPFNFVYQANITDVDDIKASVLEAVKLMTASDLITHFFKQTQTQNQASADGVTTNDATLLYQKAEKLLEDAWSEDERIKLPFDDHTNRVCDLLGININDQPLETQKRIADAVTRRYNEALKLAMNTYNWSFARRDEVINKDYSLPDVVALPWKHAYKLPDDVARVLFLCEVEDCSLVETVGFNRYIRFSFRNYEGEVILTTDHEPDFAIHYQAKISDVSELSPLLEQALDYIVAGELATNLNTEQPAQTRNNADYYTNLGFQYMQQAAGRDAQQGAYSVKQKVLSKFTRARVC